MASMTKNDDAPRVIYPRILVDGVSVIESGLASSEAYILPDIIQTKLSGCSTSSSVCAETGAPDIRHLASLSTTDEEEQPRLVDTSSVCSTAAEEPQHLLSLQNNDHKNSVGSYWDTLIAADDDTASCTSLPVKVIQYAGDESEMFEIVSSITESAFSVHRSIFDFSQSLMPELTPRRRHHTMVSSKERQRNLTVVAPTPSRYQRPVDSLLTQKKHAGHESHKNPSPIPPNAELKYRRPVDYGLEDANPKVQVNPLNCAQQNESFKLTNPNTPILMPLKTNQLKLKHAHKSEIRQSMKQSQHIKFGQFSCENFNPQSPRACRPKERKGNIIEPKRLATPKNALTSRCDTACAKQDKFIGF